MVAMCVIRNDYIKRKRQEEADRKKALLEE